MLVLWRRTRIRAVQLFSLHGRDLRIRHSVGSRFDRHRRCLASLDTGEDLAWLDPLLVFVTVFLSVIVHAETYLLITILRSILKDYSRMY